MLCLSSFRPCPVAARRGAAVNQRAAPSLTQTSRKAAPVTAIIIRPPAQTPQRYSMMMFFTVTVRSLQTYTHHGQKCYVHFDLVILNSDYTT